MSHFVKWKLCRTLLNPFSTILLTSNQCFLFPFSSIMLNKSLYFTMRLPALEWIALRSHSFLPSLINTSLSLTFSRMVLSSINCRMCHQTDQHCCYLVLFVNLFRQIHLYPFLHSLAARYFLKLLFLYCHHFFIFWVLFHFREIQPIN